MRQLLGGVVLALAVLACGDSGNEPELPRGDVAGVYDLSVLTFDPQGQALGTVDIRSRLGQDQTPSLNLSADGRAQLIYQDPQSGFIEQVPADFSTGNGTVRVVFAEGTTKYRQILLPSSITFLYDEEAGTLTFSGISDASRARLQTLVPEWKDEPLSDPVPGTLTIVFKRR